MYLYGASGHCKVIIDIIRSNYRHLIIEEVIDDDPKKNSELFDIPISDGKTKKWKKDDDLIISIGNNKIRKTLSSNINVNYLKAIHRDAIISHSATIGNGTVVMAGAILNAHCKIGEHCIINTAAVVEHDADVADYVHIAPNASIAGNVTIGEGANVGIGATIIQGINIGKWSFVGAGAVIIRDVPDFAIVVGNPGRIIKYNKNPLVSSQNIG